MEFQDFRVDSNPIKSYPFLSAFYRHK